ncbi:MAG: phage holin family protein [Cyanobacteria bacterium P01_F01_bin.53]
MLGFIISWLVMTVTFIILTQLPTGIQADDLGRAGFAALVFGLLNGLTGWFIHSTFINVISLGFVFLIGNTILFALTAFLVRGFRLRWGIMSAVIGGLGTAVIYGILFKILEIAGIVTPVAA